MIRQFNYNNFTIFVLIFLLFRFRATRTKRQWRDISFCLSLFPYSDKSFKKLSENFNCWGDKLHEDQVYESFQVKKISCEFIVFVDCNKDENQL